jgi:hypothetical protein
MLKKNKKQMQRKKVEAILYRYVGGLTILGGFDSWECFLFIKRIKGTLRNLQNVSVDVPKG